MSKENIRTEIDKLDDQLVELYLKRFDLVKEIAKIKEENGQPVSDPAREREILKRVALKAGPEFEDEVAMLFTQLFSLSRAKERRLIFKESKLEREIKRAFATAPESFPSHATVACQGTEGAFSQQATSELFKFPAILFFHSFADIFAAVEKGMCQYGVLPIENSSAGSVTAVYDQMQKHDFRIVRAVKLHVSHALLAPKGTVMSDIKEVKSHPQALSQCSIFLHSLKGVTQTPFANTALAAKELAASGRKDQAVIASRNCAELYGLEVLKDNICDTPSNFTRFICISRELEIYKDSRKISLMLTLPHKPGSLAAILAKFSSIGLNLTKLESRPIPGMEFEFRFIFEFESKPDDPDAVRLLSELSTDPEIEQFTFLGAYAEI